jgi:rhodanese-related sulfurtransferase
MKKSPVTFKSAVDNPHDPDVKDITAEELATMTDAVHVIDVRRPDEYTGELGHIAGSKLIVLDTIPARLDELPKDEPIVFVCLAGGRSTQAASFAFENGFQHVFNLKGGMLRWNELKLKTER